MPDKKILAKTAPGVDVNEENMSGEDDADLQKLSAKETHDTQPDDMQSGDMQSGETQNGDVRAGDTQAGDAQVGDAQAVPGDEKYVEQQPREQLLTAANIVTTIRIIFIPVFVFVLLAPWPSWLADPAAFIPIKPWVAAIVFTLLASTDGLDGYLARSRNEVTNLGKFLDPLADKILVTAALLALIELGQLPAWVALVIIARDFLISGLRMVASAENQVIAASYIGKAKTVLQIIAVVMFIIKDSALVLSFGSGFELFADIISWVVMIAALALTLLSMIDYFIKSSHVLGLPMTERTKR